jgi:hypothetical protein
MNQPPPRPSNKMTDDKLREAIAQQAGMMGLDREKYCHNPDIHVPDTLALD